MSVQSSRTELEKNNQSSYFNTCRTSQSSKSRASMGLWRANHVRGEQQALQNRRE